jgi:hypothetical protein
MKLYADVPGRRTRQLLGDAGVFIWILVWAEIGRVVYHAVHRLGAAGRDLHNAGNGLSHALDDAAGQASRVPFVGSPVSGPLRDAAQAAGQVAHAGAVEQSAVGRAALLLGLIVAVLPIVLLVLVWLPNRLRWIRTASATSTARDADDEELLALRALTHRALWELHRVHPRPGAAFAAGDRVVISDLAHLELAALGLRRTGPTGSPASSG